MKWIVILGVVLFFGYIVYSTIAPVTTQCEVCLDFDGQLVCRSGAGATEEEATRAAQESACGGNVSGMSESIACRAAMPASVQCSTG
jgi:hypothetical protein